MSRRPYVMSFIAFTFARSSVRAYAPSRLFAPSRVRSLATRSALLAAADPYAAGQFSLDPDSSEARELTSSMGISSDQHDALSRLASLVVDWNGRINLVSRKECSPPIVFGRHVLPSAALSAVPNCALGTASLAMDVGCGGGFPGLPLAIIYPDTEFWLVDSVGKKLKAVQDMADELGLENVRVHHGRVEELVDDPVDGRKHRSAYDVCLGRSVTALPRFCFWISDLIKKEEGKLMYIIGGDIDEIVTSQVEEDCPIDDLLETAGVSDKRCLVLPASTVKDIARKSGEVKRKVGNKSANKTKKKRSGSPKGQWKKKENGPKKNRGYDSFERFDSAS